MNQTSTSVLNELSLNDLGIYLDKDERYGFRGEPSLKCFFFRMMCKNSCALVLFHKLKVYEH